MIAIITAVTVLLISIAFLLDPKQYHPGPLALPFIGNGYQLLQFIKGNVHSHSLYYARTYGGITQLAKPFGVSHRYMFIISDPDIAKYILRTKADTFKNRPPKSLTEFVAPKGLLSLPTDQVWRTHRSILNPMLTFSEYLQAYIPSVCDLTLKMCADFAGKQYVDVQEEMTRLAFHVICDIGFDYDCSADKDGTLLQKARIASAMAVRAAVSTPSQRKKMQAETIRNLQALYDVIEALFKKFPLSQRNEIKKVTDKPNIALALITGKDEKGQQLEQNEIKDEMVTLLLAGHETTANTLSWGLYLLARDQKAQQEAYEEVKKHFLEKGLDKLDLGVLEKCEYLGMVMKETMRLYTTVPAFARHSFDEQVIKGHYFPKDSVYMISAYAMSHSRELWGPDVEEFRPRRFEKFVDPYMFLPWGGGKRICAGSNVAKMEFKLIIGILLLKFRLEFEGPEPESEAFATLAPKNGINIKLYPRED